MIEKPFYVFIPPLEDKERSKGKKKGRKVCKISNHLFFDTEATGLFQKNNLMQLAHVNGYWLLGCDEPEKIKGWEHLFEKIGITEKVYLKTTADYFDAVYAFEGIVVGANPMFDFARGAESWDVGMNEEINEPTLYRVKFRVRSKQLGYGNKITKERWYEDKHGKKRGLWQHREPVLNVLQIASSYFGIPRINLKQAAENLDTSYKKMDFPVEKINIDLPTLEYLIYDVLTTEEVYKKLCKLLSEELILRIYSGASIGKYYLKKMGIKKVKMSLEDKIPLYEAYFGGRSEVNFLGKYDNLLTNLDFFAQYPNLQIQLDLIRFLLTKKIVTRKRPDIQKELENICLEDLKEPSLWKKYSGVILKIIPTEVRLPIRLADNEKVVNVSLPFVTSKEGVWYSVFDYLYARLYNEEIMNNKGKIEIAEIIEYISTEKQDNLKGCDTFGCRIEPETIFQDLLGHRVNLKNELEDCKDSKRKTELKPQIWGVKIISNATSYGISIERNEETMKTMYKYLSSEGKVTSNKKLVEGNFNCPIIGVQITAAAKLLTGVCEIIEKKRNGKDLAQIDTDGITVENAKEIIAFWDKWELFDNKPFLAYEDVRETFILGISPKRYIKIQKSGEFWIKGTKVHGLGTYILGESKNTEEDRINLLTLGDIWVNIKRRLTTKENKWMDTIVLQKVNTNKSSELINLNTKGIFPKPYSFAWSPIITLQNPKKPTTILFDTQIPTKKPILIVEDEKELKLNSYVKRILKWHCKTRRHVAEKYFTPEPHKYIAPENKQGWMKIPSITLTYRKFITKLGTIAYINDENLAPMLSMKSKAMVRKERGKKTKMLVNKVKEKLGISLREMERQGILTHHKYSRIRQTDIDKLKELLDKSVGEERNLRNSKGEKKRNGRNC